MAEAPSDGDLEAFLDETLAEEAMSRIEQQLRADGALAARLAQVAQRRDGGCHSVASIWRQGRFACPDRVQLGNYLLEILSPAENRFIELHLDVVGCRYCRANVEDLKSRQAEASEVVEARRRRYFQSSAGGLKVRPDVR